MDRSLFAGAVFIATRLFADAFVGAHVRVPVAFGDGRDAVVNRRKVVPAVAFQIGGGRLGIVGRVYAL